MKGRSTGSSIPIPTHNAFASTPHRAFEAWLLRRGGLDLSAAPVALRLDPRGGSSITLTTTRPIERDQIVLAVPQPLLLTTALPPPLAAAARAAGLDPLGRLALRLLAEAAAAAAGVVEGGGDDTWGPYLRVLPRREDMHLPILWDDAEEEEQGQGRPSSPPPSVVGPPPQLLPLLAPSPLHDDVVECRLAMRAELTDLREALFLLRSTDKEKEGERVLRLLDWRHWTWARAVAMSRPYILVRASSCVLCVFFFTVFNLTLCGFWCLVYIFDLCSIQSDTLYMTYVSTHIFRTGSRRAGARGAAAAPPRRQQQRRGGLPLLLLAHADPGGGHGGSLRRGQVRGAARGRGLHAPE